MHSKIICRLIFQQYSRKTKSIPVNNFVIHGFLSVHVFFCSFNKWSGPKHCHAWKNFKIIIEFTNYIDTHPSALILGSLFKLTTECVWPIPLKSVFIFTKKKEYHVRVNVSVQGQVFRIYCALCTNAGICLAYDFYMSNIYPLKKMVVPGATLIFSMSKQET